MSKQLAFEFELNRKSGKNIYLSKGNEMLNANDKLHHFIRSELSNHLRELGYQKAQLVVPQQEETDEERKPIFNKKNPCHMFVVVCPPTKRKQDAPNWYPTIKPIIDGFTQAGVFEDDNDEVVTSITFIPGPKSKNKKYKFIIDIIEGVIYK